MLFNDPDEDDVDERCDGISPCEDPCCLPDCRGEEVVLCAAQDALLRGLVKVCGGGEVRTEGDGRVGREQGLETLVFGLGDEEAEDEDGEPVL